MRVRFVPGRARRARGAPAIILTASILFAGCVDLQAQEKDKPLASDFTQTIVFELRGEPDVEEKVRVDFAVDNSTLWVGPIPASNGTGKYLHFSVDLKEGAHESRVHVAEWGGSWKAGFDVPTEKPAVVVEVGGRSVTFHSYKTFDDADAANA